MSISCPKCESSNRIKINTVTVYPEGKREHTAYTSTWKCLDCDHRYHTTKIEGEFYHGSYEDVVGPAKSDSIDINEEKTHKVWV